MTQLLEQAIEAARQLTPAEQDELARTIMAITGSDYRAPVRLTDADRAALEESLAAADRGEFATDAEVAALWAKYDL